MTPQSAEIIRLTRKLDEVTAERDFYRREVEGERDEDRIALLEHRLQLTRREALLLDALYRTRRIRTKEAVFIDVWGDSEVEIKILDVYICKLRKKIGFGSIETIWGNGHILTEAGRRLVAETLANGVAA